MFPKFLSSILSLYSCICDRGKDLFMQEPQSVTPVKKYGTESDSKFRRSIIDRQHVCSDPDRYLLHFSCFYS